MCDKTRPNRYSKTKNTATKSSLKKYNNKYSLCLKNTWSESCQGQYPAPGASRPPTMYVSPFSDTWLVPPKELELENIIILVKSFKLNRLSFISSYRKIKNYTVVQKAFCFIELIYFYAGKKCRSALKNCELRYRKI